MQFNEYRLVHQVAEADGNITENILPLHTSVYYSAEFANDVLTSLIPKKVPKNQKYFVRKVTKDSNA